MIQHVWVAKHSADALAQLVSCSVLILLWQGILHMCKKALGSFGHRLGHTQQHTLLKYESDTLVAAIT